MEDVGKNWTCGAVFHLDPTVVCDKGPSQHYVWGSWNSPSEYKYSRHTGPHHNARARVMWWDSAETRPTLAQRIVDFLAENRGTKFTAQQLAFALNVSVKAVVGAMSWMRFSPEKSKNPYRRATLLAEGLPATVPGGVRIIRYRPDCKEGCFNWWGSSCHHEKTLGATKG